MIALPGSIDENKTKKNRRCGNSTKHGDDAGARVTCSDEKSHKAENGDPRMDVMGSKTKRFGTRGRAGAGWRGLAWTVEERAHWPTPGWGRHGSFSFQNDQKAFRCVPLPSTTPCCSSEPHCHAVGVDAMSHATSESSARTNGCGGGKGTRNSAAGRPKALTNREQRPRRIQRAEVDAGRVGRVEALFRRL